ncbi:alpha/beta fold hydrolase [Candidatus Laterigemmans baculatus]|uniref:alpha/beta fold hydrolase n=1 Tax=Candidatus Laterigemmans baculatus TaxID=2770505 RepID=UPI0013DCCC27|nr:alpha/beta fold hydrolase [Candidatus Laterigemmans baculatus]
MHSPAPRIESFTATDGYAFACRRWESDAPRANVVVLHGIISHSGWYLKTGEHLAQAGFAVHALDRRGSGSNGQARGDVDRYPTWIADVEQYIEALGDNVPVLLVGISWGGLLATAVARRHPERIAGLGLICPGLFARKGTSAIQYYAVRTAARWGMASWRFPVPLRDPRLFTDSPSWQAFIRDDPETLRKVTLRLARASGELYLDTVRDPELIRVPTLLMLAGKDPIIKNEEVRAFVEKFSTGQQTILEYPEASHTLEFEPDPSKYLSDLEAWCRAASERR